MKTYTEEEVKQLCDKAHNAGFKLANYSARTNWVNQMDALGSKSLDGYRFEEWWDKNKKK